MKNSLLIKTLVCKFVSVLTVVSVFGQADTARINQYNTMSLKDLLNVKVITASKTLQELGLTPATVIVITEEQIKMRGYQSLLDVMYDLPDIKVDDKIYSGMRNSFTIRGTQGSEKLVILLDGIAISSPSGEAMPIMENYPVNLAQQIEVVYGPASALYGANAVSGIINIITKKALSRKNINIEASSVGGNYGYSNSTLFITKKLNDQVNLTISGQYAYDNGVDYSRLYKNDSSWNVDSYSTGIFNTIYGSLKPVKPVSPKYEAPMKAYNIYAALNAANFSFTLFKSYTNTPTSFGANTNNTVYNKDVFMAQNITTANASYKKSYDKITSSTSLTGSEYNLDPKTSFRNLYTSMEPAYKYSLCTMIKGEEQVDYKATNNLNVTIGAGYEHYNSIPQSTDLNDPVNPEDFIHGTYLGTRSYFKPDGLPAQFYFIKYYNLGTYFQAQYAHKNINITIGSRYDINSRYGSTFNPRVGIVYQLSVRTTLKALYGSAFLAPTLTDSYSQYGSFDTPDSGRTYHSNFLHLPNPDLKPVKSQNAELNIRHSITDNLILTLDGYYTALSGLLVFADDNASTHLYNNTFNDIPVDYIEVFINQDKQKNYGGSAQLNWKYSIGNVHFNSSASVNYVNGEVKSGNNPAGKKMSLDFIAPVMIHIGTDLKAGKFTAAPRLILMGRQNLTGIGDTTSTIMKRQTIPGYALLNVSMRYAVNKKISFFANITNALNQHYRSVGFNMDLSNKNTELFYGLREDPIRIMGGMNFTF